MIVDPMQGRERRERLEIQGRFLEQAIEDIDRLHDDIFIDESPVGSLRWIEEAIEVNQGLREAGMARRMEAARGGRGPVGRIEPARHPRPMAAHRGNEGRSDPSPTVAIRGGEASEAGS
jgi:hypothetical protein